MLIVTTLQRCHASWGAPAPGGPGRRRPAPGQASLERRRVRHGAAAQWRAVSSSGKRRFIGISLADHDGPPVSAA